MATTRLGAYGGPRSPYGSFDGKSLGGLEIAPTGIASAEAFGSATITLYITPSGIASAEAFGSATITIDITPSGIASAEAFGTAVVVPILLNITPLGIVSAEAFGTASLLDDDVVVNKFGKKFYAAQSAKHRKLLSLQMRQQDEEILAIIQIIGKFLL